MRKTLIYILFVFSILPALSDSRLSIKYLTNNDGLSNSSVNCIIQDSSRLIWFGTWDGLNLYNGSEFEIFKPNPSKPKSISNNIIRNIVLGGQGELWIETDNGIDRYNPATKSFDYYLGSNTVVFKEHSFLIARNSKGQIFASVYESGLFCFDSKSNDFVRVNMDGVNAIRKIFFDKNDDLWVYTDNRELYKLTFNYGSEIPAYLKTEKVNAGANIEAVFYNESEDQLWIQYTSNLISIISPANEKRISDTNLNLKGRIQSVLFLDEYYLIGTENTLYKIDKSGSGFNVEVLLSGVSVLSVFKDRQDIIWVGTDAQGVLMLTQPKEKFLTFNLRNFPDLGTSPVRTFYESDDRHLWVGTKGKGLFLIEQTPDYIGIEASSRFTTDNGLISNSVYSIAGTPDESQVWIGTEGHGLNYYDQATRKMFSLEMDKEIHLSAIYSIYAQNANTLWIGTSGYGLYKLEIDNSKHPYRVRKYTQYTYQSNTTNSINNNVVYSIIPDGEYLWIGTRGGGLNLFNMKSGQFESFRYSAEDQNSISNDDILCLYKDRKYTLWVGTSNGLNKLIRLEKGVAQFKRYTEKDGIPNNTIHGILEDLDGNLWLSSNNGISKLNPDNDKIISYYQTDGLQNNEFSDGASYVSRDGSFLYFGGISGYNKFDPMKISRNTFMPSLYLDAFTVNNEEAGLNNYLIDRKGEDILQMNFQDKFFSFRFVLLDYIDGPKCELAYQLKNYQEDWVKLGSSRTIVFSNLPAGHYVLNVKWSNADKEWNEDIYSLPIEILPPWWLSWYAYMTYAVIVILLVYLAYRISKNRMIMHHRLELKTLETQKSEEIHQAKLRFFTNIAHEFSNSLTLIYGPSEQLLKATENDAKTRKYLNIIRSNAERMQGMIQQLMEFRKAETGYLEVEIELVDIPELIKYTTDHFVETAEQKKVQFNVIVDPALNMWPTDRSCFEKILFNLLSNAFKYTPEQGTVELQVNIVNQNLVFQILNTGAGIKEEDQEQIFNRFTILDRFENQVLKGAGTRSGIGLAMCKSLVDLLQGTITVNSKPNEFTSFVVTLKPLELSKQEKVKSDSDIYSVQDFPMTRTPDVGTGTDEITKEAKQTKPYILIIEDDPDIRMFLSDILSDKYEIAVAAGGSEAFDLIKKQLPDLIICDIIMPEISGVEVIRLLKEQEITAYIPVIILSSEGSVERQIEGFQVGADAYLTKPFHARHLEVIIEQLLNRKKNLKLYFESPVSSIENMDGKQVRKEEKEFILKLTKIVSESMDNEKLSLDTLFREMGISKIQLYRKLKEIKGETPTEFIRNIRLKHAEKLLKTTNKTVQEIMYNCGFNNKAYFYREFQKQYNQTPKEYRNSHQS